MSSSVKPSLKYPATNRPSGFERQHRQRDRRPFRRRASQPVAQAANVQSDKRHRDADRSGCDTGRTEERTRWADGRSHFRAARPRAPLAW